MCDPLSISAAAVTGGSVIANMMGANQQSAARDAAIAGENQRQQQFQQQSTDMFNKTLPLASRPTQEATAATSAANRTATTDGALDSSFSQGGPAQNIGTSDEGKSQIARSIGMALTRGKQQAARAAAVTGVGDATSKVGVDLGRASQWQNIFANNAQHSANILPLELEDANRAGNGMRTIGAIGGALGSGLGMAGIMGKGPSWGDLFGGGGFTPSFVPGAAGAPIGAI